MEEVTRKRKYFSPDTSNKRFRNSGCDSGYGESQSQVQAQAGTIKEVVLLNFMCHESIAMTFPTCVSFITGRNGTGKSALLTALVVGLGGRASDTNRGYSLKEFVKTDEHSATVKIVINNQGFNAFQPDTYGDEIIVQRTIGQTSSQYKIMASDGSVVSHKHEDLMRILTYLNLQVDNPVAILTQDTARNFLHNTKPTDKYLFFLKATRLEYIQTIYKKVYDTLSSTRTSQEYRIKLLESMKEEKQELERKLKRLQTVEQTRDRLEAAQNELYWANVVQVENKLRKMEESKESQENVCTQIEEETSKLEEMVEQISENKKVLESKSELLAEQCRANNKKCSDLKSACEKVNNSRKVKHDEIMSKKDDASRIKKTIESINKQIAELQATLDSETLPSKRDLEKSLKKLEDEKKEAEAQFKTNQHDLGKLEAALEQDTEALQSLDEELNRLNLSAAQAQSMLKSLEGKEENTLRLFGENIVALNRAIADAFNKGKFSKMPRGPLGSYIRVKDESWAPTVESAIGGELLKSYLVNNHQDRKFLYSLMSRVIDARSPIPSVTTTRFMDKVYDYEKNAVHCPGHCSLLKMIEVSDHLVTNCLIDLLSVETVLLVESPSAARGMMCNEKNTPKNCKKVITKNGDVYYPDPNYRSYAGNNRNAAKFLKVSVEDAKKRLLQESSNSLKWAENTNSQRNVVAKHFKSHKSEIQVVKTVLDNLSKKILSIKHEMMELQQIEPVDANQINFWIDERETYVKDLEKTEELLKQSRLEYEDIEESYKEMFRNYSAMKEETKQKSRELDLIVNKFYQLDNKLTDKKAAMDGAVKKKLDTQKTLKMMETQIAEQRKLVEKSISDALQLTKERVNTFRKIPEITEEIKELKNEIERVERSEGDPKELGERFTALKLKCDEISRKINVLNECVVKMKSMLGIRRRVYSRCLQLLVTRMQIVFQSLIDRRRFQGGIEVDHNERKLDIKVTLRNPSPKNQQAGAKRAAGTGDPKSLSGGERSFCTVAFILALWDAVELPFYALDEFDVFMDNANREMTLELLLTHSQEKKDFKFVFLTPQDITTLSSREDVTIYRLNSHAAQRKAVC